MKLVEKIFISDKEYDCIKQDGFYIFYGYDLYLFFMELYKDGRIIQLNKKSCIVKDIIVTENRMRDEDIVIVKVKFVFIPNISFKEYK